MTVDNNLFWNCLVMVLSLYFHLLRTAKQTVQQLKPLTLCLSATVMSTVSFYVTDVERLSSLFQIFIYLFLSRKAHVKLLWYHT